jgi:EF hand
MNFVSASSVSSFRRASALALATALFLAGAESFAQGADPGQHPQQMAAMAKRFAAADANGDGKLTKEEAKGKMPFVYKHFDEIDTSHSGAVTLADITAFAQARQAARKAAN